MLRTGEKQELTVVKEVDFGIYLAEKLPESNKESQEKVLLPKKEVPEGTKKGDRMQVFLYRDSMDRIIATRREPLLTAGKFAVLKVKEVSSIGAFLDWGLEKDLLLPYHEQTAKVHAGDECLVALYVDRSDRLCATMRVYPYLYHNSPYRINDDVSGRVYELSNNFGTFVAVDDKYSGLIPRREGATGLKVGDRIRARVTGVKEDGKLDLSIREKAYLQMDEDAEMVMSVIEEYAGVLPFDDRVDPEIIRREFGLSKNAFKRAVGRLMKQGRAEIRDHRIYKLEAQPNAKPDTRPDRKSNAKPDTRPDRKPNAKPDTRPGRKPNARPDTKRNKKPNVSPDVKPGTVKQIHSR